MAKGTSRHTDVTALIPAPLGMHVEHVLLLCAKPEVPPSRHQHTIDLIGSWVVVADTGRVIASVSDDQTRGYGLAGGDLPGGDVRRNAATARSVADLPVPKDVGPADPLPAASVLADIQPETVWEWDNPLSLCLGEACKRAELSIASLDDRRVGSERLRADGTGQDQFRSATRPATTSSTIRLHHATPLGWCDVVPRAATNSAGVSAARSIGRMGVIG